MRGHTSGTDGLFLLASDALLPADATVANATERRREPRVNARNVDFRWQLDHLSVFVSATRDRRSIRT